MYIYMNTESETRVLTRDEYRIFTDFTNDNYEDMYSEKVGYEVNYNPGKDNFTVTYSTKGVDFLVSKCIITNAIMPNHRRK